MRTRRDGLRIARLLMVLSSMAPLFVLWTIRGSKLISDIDLVALCALVVAIPYLFLALRIRTAIRQEDKRELQIGKADDHRDHLLVYLFAMLLPLFALGLETPRDVLAAVVALVFMTFLFWHLDLHYMNVLFAVLGYRVFTVFPEDHGNPLTTDEPNVLITQRRALGSGQVVVAYRLSNTVYLEVAGRGS